VPGKILWGMVADRLGREITYSVGILGMLAAIALLVLIGTAPLPWLVFPFALAFALGYGVTAPLGPAAAADIFAGRNFGAIYGVLSVGIGLGSAFGAWFAGFVFDATGSYVVAFAVAAASSTGGAVCLWLAAPRRVRRVVRQGPR
jgi:MFS family permease